MDRHDVAAADKYFGKDPIHNNPRITIEGFKQNIGAFFQRFPDSRTAIDHIVAEDDKVFAMLTTTASDKQTGKKATMKSADLYRIENGMIVEHWDVVDASEIA